MIFPTDGRSVPASSASSVDLPAPFGPISPVSVPRLTVSETSATACTPPKSRLRPTAWRTSSLCSAPGSPCRARAVSPRVSRPERPSLAGGAAAAAAGPPGGGPHADEADQHGAGQAGNGPAEHQHAGPERQQVLAERVRHLVVVPHRPERPPVR